MTPGLAKALAQLRRMADAEPGAIEIIEVDTSRGLTVTVSIDCHGMPQAPGGAQVRDRERFHLTVPADFPFKIPTVKASHKRWATVPHVQWGNQLCIYQAPEAEWDPSDGMFGFLSRLLVWLRAAASNTLDPIGGPMHPPVAYASSGCPMIIPRANTPAVSSTNWWGFARLRVHGPSRRDVVGWCEIDDVLDASAAGDVVAPAVLLADAMPWEYPSTFVKLLIELVTRGVPKSLLFRMMDLGRLLNDEDEHVYIVVGSPMRGTVGEDAIQHLSVWRFESQVVSAFYKTVSQSGDSDETGESREALFGDLIDWALRHKIEVEWCPVREARAEVIRPRDEGSAVTRWAGKRVVIFGCGALGSIVAEHLVRAGVSHLTLCDNASVAPGVLVRQNFEDADLGNPKSEALAARLLRIRPELEIAALTADLTTDPGSGWDCGADVVFDLTASASVAQRLELSRRLHPTATVVGMTISRTAQYGLVVVSSPAASGGVVDLRRKAKLSAARSANLRELTNEFWPEQDAETTVFQPEPGCSSPTFVGSNADVAALAASMLLIAASSDDAMCAGFVSLPSATAPGRTTQFAYTRDVVVEDVINGYELRIAPIALAEMRGWASRSHRLSPADETGGHLFGERDDAIGVIWVTDAMGPPPDSVASPVLFRCGTAGVADATDAIKKRSRGSSAPVGMWHTHPKDLPLPSPTDHEGMTQIIEDLERPNPTQVLIILGGSPGEHLLGGYVYERGKTNEHPRNGRVLALDDGAARARGVGLALSGGGSRAIAFHLGVLRALHDRSLLDRVEVVSAVSGGSVIASMWAYSSEPFEQFDARVTQLLESGLQRRLATIALASPLAMRIAANLVVSVALAPLRLLSRALRRGGPPERSAFRRRTSLTTALERTLHDIFEGAALDEPARDVHVIINACDLRTGTAFRFGSIESGSSKYGRLADNHIPVAFAAATSAAYPVILPAVDADLTFVRRDGSQERALVVLTDGGVFDNLGTSALLPRRTAEYSTNVHPIDYLISADAGFGALDVNRRPALWPSRMRRAFESVYRKVQDTSKSLIYEHTSSGALKGVVLPFLGQQDRALPIRPDDLVTRERVIGYPTNFGRMRGPDIALLSLRGEQLTRVMLEHHCPHLI